MKIERESHPMDQQETPSPREHHFYVSIAKFLFRHPDLGTVPVMDPIRIGHAKTHASNR